VLLSPTATLEITQGTTRSIVVSGIVDANGVALDVTGWVVRAQARREPQAAPLLAEWVSGTPIGAQGQAVASVSTVTLTITPVMSDTWTWRAAVLHIEVTEPVPPFREERIGDVKLILDHTAIR